ncbi:MAG: quercetin 2,3-dioxygenase [Chloroflexota bacterium]|nr:quercetin 2,3-dioxygenase [Chloroflexota bacterium]
MINTTTLSTVRPVALPPGGGERIWITGDTVQIKATAPETRGAFTMLEVIAMPGGGPPPHTHEREDEAFYVLDGEFELLVGDQIVRGEPGTYVFVPSGTVHRFGCVGDRPGRILIVFTPGGIEGFFREAGTQATDDGPPPPLDAEEIARTEVAAPRYGLRVVEWAGSSA